MERLRAAVLLAGFVLATLLLIPLQWLFLRLKSPWARHLPVLYHRWLCGWLGIAIKVSGAPASKQGVLFLSNHTSYFDILILSTVQPVAFVAKREVASWPFFGLLAKLQRTVFVERERRTKTLVHRDEMALRLTGGDNLVLFPEGTSNDGNVILPFKSALIGVAELALKAKGDAPVVVQPVSLSYRRLHGLPMGRQYRPFFAWYGDMELVTHLWDALCLGPIEVQVTYHPPIDQAQSASRKAIAVYCHRVIGNGIAESLAAR